MPATELFLTSLVVCANHKIIIDASGIIDFNKFLQLPTVEQSLLQRCPLFEKGTIDGILTFARSSAPALTNLDKLDLLNIKKLALNFQRNILSGELAFLKEIKGLEELVMKNGLMPDRPFPATAYTEFDEVLSSGLPSIIKLKVQYDMFDAFYVDKWWKYFPNLKEVKISNCKCIRDDFIWLLSGLEFLTDLNLSSLDSLEDITFTWPYEPHFAVDDGDVEMVPAICRFKNLECLELRFCPQLSDNCVINGIAHCKTLKSLAVKYCKRITEKCLDLVTCQEKIFWKHWK